MLVALFLFAACGSTAAVTDQDEITSPAAGSAPAPVVSATDPRVSELQVVVAELLDRIEVLNARVAKLESGAPQPQIRVAEETPVQAQPPAAPAAAPSRPATQPARSTRAARGVTPPSAGAALAESYRGALELYGKGHIDEARNQFQAVFDADPAGDLADNALYWIGETYFSTGKYNEAIKVYARVIGDYGDQNKAPDAMLKTGLAQAKLGDLTLARQTFEQLIAKYPYSTPAAAAKYELKRIKY